MIGRQEEKLSNRGKGIGFIADRSQQAVDAGKGPYVSRNTKGK